MRTEAIHRIIEAQVAIRGDDPAIVGPDYEVSYRELNSRANRLARQFLAAGLRRCGHGVVTQAPRPDLIVTLLAILKTGASYAWTRPLTSPAKVCPSGRSWAELSSVGCRCWRPVTNLDRSRICPC